ncbi:hypothetical protein SDC9_63594 [bioreactor metagenome]|uniref:PBP domain-containing protein n=1 Tax=bioreactor metagenome TaxID=1076179 RepID=A0A644XLY8_9ZZZZ
MTQKWAEEFMKENSDVRIDISAGGAGKGMTDVLNGMVDMAMFSRSVSAEEEQQGAWKISVAKDVVLPTINAGNPVYAELMKRGLTKDEFRKIYITQEITNWSQLKLKNGGGISLFTRSDACGASEMWAKFMGGAQEDLKGVGVFGDPGIADAVKNDPKGVGFNNIIYAYDFKSGKIQEGIGIIPIDINENGQIDPEEDLYSDMKLLTAAIRDGKFPEPPARPLYFICKGKPTNALVVAFLKYILTTGQQWVEESGYVKLPESVIKEEQKKLD